MALINKEPYITPEMVRHEQITIYNGGSNSSAILYINGNTAILRIWGVSITNGVFPFTVPSGYCPAGIMHNAVAIAESGTGKFYTGFVSMGSDGEPGIYKYDNGSATKPTGAIYGELIWSL